MPLKEQEASLLHFPGGLAAEKGDDMRVIHLHRAPGIPIGYWDGGYGLVLFF